jgi:putative transposase
MRRGRRPPGAQGARSNDKIPEPADHAIGWSRGGLSSKVHPLADAGIRPVAPLLDALALAGHRPVHLLADKACSHPSTRRQLRRRLIRNAIPERSDQVKRREDKGSAGGRLSKFDAELYKQRNIVETSKPQCCHSRGCSASLRDPSSSVFIKAA